MFLLLEVWPWTRLSLLLEQLNDGQGASRRQLLLGFHWVEDAVAMWCHYFRLGVGEAGRAQWSLRARDLWADVSAPQMFSQEACALGTDPLLSAWGWVRGHFMRGISQFHIAHLSVLPVGFFLDTEWRNSPLLFPLSFLCGKTSPQDRHRLMLTEAWELPSWIRQGLCLASCHVFSGVQQLIFREGSRSLAGSTYLIKFSRGEFFFL